MVRTYKKQSSIEQICQQQGMSWQGIAERRSTWIHFNDFFYLFCISAHIVWIRKWHLHMARILGLIYGLIFVLWLFGLDVDTHDGLYLNWIDYKNLQIDDVVEKNIKYINYNVLLFLSLNLIFALMLFHENLKVSLKILYFNSF